jgi:hypothetical protein
VSATANGSAAGETSASGKRPVIIAGHQPHYLPWLGYMSKILQCDKFCLVDSIQFEKKNFQNRNRIRSNQGEVMLSVPVVTAGRFYQNICDVEINEAEPWRRKHWKSILLGYQKAPHFKRYADFFEDVYNREWKMLVDLNEHMLRGLLGFFEIEKEIVRSVTFMPSGKKTDLLIDICRKTGSDGYLSGGGGAKQYVEEHKFTEAGLVHRFQSFHHPVYPQVHGGEFMPRLAAIDLLFNCGPESGAILREASKPDAQ